jgi:hypothetical protein
MVEKIAAIHESLISRLPDLYESRHEAEGEIGGHADYIEGLIDGYTTALRLMGIPDSLIPVDPYQEAENA